MIMRIPVTRFVMLASAGCKHLVTVGSLLLYFVSSICSFYVGMECVFAFFCFAVIRTAALTSPC